MYKKKSNSAKKAGLKVAVTSPYLRKQSAHLHIHDVVPVELGQALEVIVSEDRGVGHQAPGCCEGQLKPLPHSILVWVHHLWVLPGPQGHVGYDAGRTHNNSH